MEFSDGHGGRRDCWPLTRRGGESRMIKVSSGAWRTVIFLIAVAATSCERRQPSTSATSTEPTAASQSQAAEEPLPPSELDTQLPAAVRDAVLKPFTGDFDAMVEHRLIRIGVTFNRTLYFVDKGVQRGVMYEYG